MNMARSIKRWSSKRDLGQCGEVSVFQLLRGRFEEYMRIRKKSYYLPPRELFSAAKKQSFTSFYFQLVYLLLFIKFLCCGKICHLSSNGKIRSITLMRSRKWGAYHEGCCSNNCTVFFSDSCQIDPDDPQSSHCLRFDDISFAVFLYSSQIRPVVRFGPVHRAANNKRHKYETR